MEEMIEVGGREQEVGGDLTGEIHPWNVHEVDDFGRLMPSKWDPSEQWYEEEGGRLVPVDALEDSGGVEEGEESLPLVESARDAEMHLRSIAYWRRERQQAVEHAEREQDRVNTWLKSETSRIDRRIVWHEGGLRVFLVQAGKRSLRLINGTLRFLKGRERIDVLDAEKFLTWAKEHAPALIRVKEEADKRAIFDHIKACGEVPEGCDLVVSEDKFQVKVG